MPSDTVQEFGKIELRNDDDRYLSNEELLSGSRF